MSESGTAPIATTAFIGLGSNLGDRQAMIEAALGRIAAHQSIELTRYTELIETAPWGVEDQPLFLNAVAEIQTILAPLAVLRELKSIERDLGRRAGGPRWGPREIDLDVLLFGDQVVETSELVVPHPQLCERQFVLRQVIQLDDRLIHPVHRVPLATFLQHA